MIVASLLLILVAVVLLVLGLAGGSSVLLTISIAASLLAAVALVAGARQAAVNRAAADPGGPGWRPRQATRPAEPASARGRSAEPEIPVQHVPPTIGSDGTGWRQPPEPPVADGDVPAAPPGVGPAVPYDDEPPAQDVAPVEAARVARLDAEVRVVDGRPRYHLPDCAHLAGREHEPIPVAEAVELGFTPCARCAPDTTLLADAGRI
ncbi:hypothetical protein AB0I85_11495 [Micromonospora echinofusca]|uniref:hypothetical protein n=1 Tax=Micromonospora echinofusca TaxID=47858 RepID=UPI000C710D04|nr:hypothetical protein [Micromonospora sp. MSM11]MCL7455629.1 hypothetical protein [Micromonospora sp. MSM11]